MFRHSPSNKQKRPVIEELENRRLLSSTSLTFNGAAGGLGQTGFTSVLAGSSGQFISADVSAGSGQLNLTSTRGDLLAGNQDNALAVDLDSTQGFIVQTTLSGINFRKKYQSAGIFVGIDQNNYVKFVAGQFGQTGLQLAGEINGVFTASAVPPLDFASIQTLDLRLVGDPATHTIIAEYRINSSSDSDWITFGQTTNTAVFSSSGKAGILDTNYGTRKPVTVAFSSFSAQNVGTPGSGTTPDQPASLSVGANVDATPLSLNQASAQIAVNPTNPNNLVLVTENAQNPQAVLVSYSFNGGQSWTLNYITSDTDGLPPSNPRVDARAAFDRFGNLYIAYEVAANRNEICIVVARSSNGGQTFSAATIAIGGAGSNIDYPDIATGPASAGSNDQAVWISYTDYSNPNATRVKAVYATSSGVGQLGSFSSPETVSAPGGDLSNLAVGPEGQVAVVYETTQSLTGPDDIMISAKADGTGGGGFGRDILASTTNVGTSVPIPAEPHRTIDAVPQVAFDRSGDSTTGRLYFVYTDAAAPGSSDTNIELRYSDNLGNLFSNPLRVNDDETAKSQFLPALSVDQATGNVGISWLDARHSRRNDTVQEYAAVSLTHGTSVLANVLVSAGTSNEADAYADGESMDFGDVTGAAFADNRLIVAWPDNSDVLGQNPNRADSYFDIYVGSVTVNPSAS